jgi:hypothetical protein
MTFLLRIEAVNLANFIYDTTDLSTIRGGGLLLLECARDLPKTLPNLELEVISTGASKGTFSFEAAGEQEADEKRREVERCLSGHKSYQDATIVVEVTPLGDFQTSLRTVDARNRWRQLQSPTVVYPPGGDDDVCRFDRVRPMADTMQKGVNEKPRPISRAAFTRREAGLGQKHHQFYVTYAGLPEGEVEFVNDFHQLSDLPSQKRLHHKIAVIYLDGNKFGQIFSKLDKDQYNACARQLQDASSAFLKEMLTTQLPPPRESGTSDAWHWSGTIVTNQGNEIQKKNAIRLETLLWGGDEILWVVPAWAGWWWLQKFCELWGKQSGRQFQSHDLSYGAGLVFCHHDAPIQGIKNFANSLADFAKPRGPFRFAYQVLESFDYLGEDVITSRNRRLPEDLRFPEGEDSEFLTLPGESMKQIHRLVQELKRLPRGRVHAVAVELCRHQRVKQALEIGQPVLRKQKLEKEFEEFCHTLYPALQTIEDKYRAAAWIHLNDLWDYLPQLTWESLNA